MTAALENARVQFCQASQGCTYHPAEQKTPVPDANGCWYVLTCPGDAHQGCQRFWTESSTDALYRIAVQGQP